MPPKTRKARPTEAAHNPTKNALFSTANTRAQRIHALAVALAEQAGDPCFKGDAETEFSRQMRARYISAAAQFYGNAYNRENGGK